MADSEQNHSTLHGLDHWFKYTFEKLGWVVLAIHKNKDESHSDKVKAYKSSVKRLINNLNSRLSNPQGNNTIVRDYPVMIEDLKLLLQFVENMSSSLSEAPKNEADLAAEDATLCGLQNWFRHIFEKFGWMVLTANRINSGRYANKPVLEQHKRNKINMYKQGIDILYQSLLHRLTTTNDVDKSNVEFDLASMIRNLKILRNCVEAHIVLKPVESRVTSVPAEIPIISASRFSATPDVPDVSASRLSATSPDVSRKSRSSRSSILPVNTSATSPDVPDVSASRLSTTSTTEVPRKSTVPITSLPKTSKVSQEQPKQFEIGEVVNEIKNQSSQPGRGTTQPVRRTTQLVREPSQSVRRTTQPVRRPSQNVPIQSLSEVTPTSSSINLENLLVDTPVSDVRPVSVKNIAELTKYEPVAQIIERLSSQPRFSQLGGDLNNFSTNTEELKEIAALFQ